LFLIYYTGNFFSQQTFSVIKLGFRLTSDCIRRTSPPFKANR